jgi:hypothetical protein
MIRTKAGAAALAAAGVLFLLYPAVRPWHDESTVDGAVASMSSGAWVAAHLFAMIGFILVPLGLLALRDALRDTAAAPLALTAAVTAWVGAGLTLPYYGAEDFGLHALARAEIPDLLAVVDEVRFTPVAAVTFAAGLLALGAGAVLAAVAVARSGRMSRWSAIPFAAGFALFIPQFYLPAPVRIAHGVLVAAGCAWLAVDIWRLTRRDMGYSEG